MKKTVLILLLGFMGTAVFASSFSDYQQKKKKKAKMALKTHVCTAACLNGKHVYLHGEKGHVCGPECMKPKM